MGQQQQLLLHRGGEPLAHEAATQLAQQHSDTRSVRAAHSSRCPSLLLATPYITPSMTFSSGKGEVWGRRGQQLEFSLRHHENNIFILLLFILLYLLIPRHQVRRHTAAAPDGCHRSTASRCATIKTIYLILVFIDTFALASLSLK